jgi:hypothetical protein
MAVTEVHEPLSSVIWAALVSPDRLIAVPRGQQRFSFLFSFTKNQPVVEHQMKWQRRHEVAQCLQGAVTVQQSQVVVNIC